MKTVTSYSKGVLAEERAAKQLKRDGYTVIKKRYKTKFGEIDIIARKRDLIAFVEVKAHQSVRDSLYAVTPKTRRRIEQSALWFLSEYPEYSSFDMRFDVIAFSGDLSDESICGEHLDNAWMVGA
ncbi:MAG: YraN family protein [Alphaproteobacteria bacterium]|nr:YraN family protein [Alphaproteobacteria bacterium]